MFLTFQGMTSPNSNFSSHMGWKLLGGFVIWLYTGAQGPSGTTKTPPPDLSYSRYSGASGSPILIFSSLYMGLFLVSSILWQRTAT